MRRKFSDQQAVQAVSDKRHRSVSSVLRVLGVSAQSGSSHRLIRSIAKKYSVDVSHLAGNGWAKGIARPEFRKPSVDKHGRCNPSTNLVRLLIRDGVKQRRCERCNRRTWNGEPIPLERHHIDGNKHNHALSNIAVICPNCHAQTDNYSGKNRGRAHHPFPGRLVKPE